MLLISKKHIPGVISSLRKDIVEVPEDPDGGRQVIEVMGEGVQSQPSRAVKEAWSMDTDGNKLVNKKEGE